MLATFSKLEARPPPVPCSVQVITETSNTVVSEDLPPVQVSSYSSFLDKVMARDGEKYPVHDVP